MTTNRNYLALILGAESGRAIIGVLNGVQDYMNYLFGIRTDTIISFMGMAISWQAYLILILSWGFVASLVVTSLYYINEMYKAEKVEVK